MNEFDPQASPEDGWALLAEVTWPGKEPILLKKNWRIKWWKLWAVGLLDDNSSIVGTHIWVTDPAYVILRTRHKESLTTALSF